LRGLLLFFTPPPPRARGGGAAPTAEVALHPHKAVEMLERSRATVEVIVRDEVSSAPRSSLNCEMGATRSFAVVRLPLSDLKGVKAKLGGTVNDVALAAVTGGLRRLLEARGEEPPAQGLRAMVPMNVRETSEKLGLGNKISSLFVHLPVAAETTADRYRRVMAETEALKAGTQSLGTSTIISLAGLAPPVIHATIARTLYATRLFNLTVTNVPGPQMTLYALGARLREILPLVPLAAEHAVGVAIFSYDGSVFFGINAASDAVPDLDLLRDGIAEEIEALCDLTAAGGLDAAQPDSADEPDLGSMASTAVIEGEDERRRVLVAGGGVAGVEALLALSALAPAEVSIELMAPEPAFTYRPLSVAEPFELAETRRLSLADLAAEQGARYRRDALVELDPRAQIALTSGGAELDYDFLVVAVGARATEALPNALTFRGPADIRAFARLLGELERGDVKRLAFAVPHAARWPLPIYELALMTAAHLAARGASREIAVVTHERDPLDIFGPGAGER
jgi:NADPH-dependent 2,4-dienoyl-CoA reductase/sulfur reductase-like enzyme